MLWLQTSHSLSGRTGRRDRVALDRSRDRNDFHGVVTLHFRKLLHPGFLLACYRLRVGITLDASTLLQPLSPWLEAFCSREQAGRGGREGGARPLWPPRLSH